MGLVKALKDAASTMMADQWREYFYCDALPNDILVKKGQRRVTEGRNSNTKASDDIISNGSIIAVNEGQCMIIVDQGGVVDVCAVAGEYVYDSSTEPSLFFGELGENVKQTFSMIGKRFTFGGNTAKDQRVYYINTLEIMDNLFGTASPMPFLYVDDRVGVELEVDIRFNGSYSFRITDPLLFYKNVCGNVADTYERSKLQSIMKGELMTAMQPALGRLGDLRIRVSDIPKHTVTLTEELNKELSVKWAATRGIEVVSLNMNAPTMPDETRKKINDAQMDVAYKDADMRMARTSGAMSQAMVDAANNSAGAERGTMGMGMAMMMGGMAGNMLGNNPGGGNAMFQNFGGGNMQQGTQQGMPQMQPAGAMAAGAAAGAAAPVLGWNCKCGKSDNRGRFCEECGSPKPSEAGWTCSCGTVNQGKFCMNCGTKKPEGAPLYKCDKCGWEPEDPAHPPKFCPECGDPFDENDRA